MEKQHSISSIILNTFYCKFIMFDLPEVDYNNLSIAASP